MGYCSRSISLSWHVFIYAGIYYAPASIVSPVSYVGIAFNAFWGWAIWHQIPDIYVWLGAFFIILSILLTTKIAKY